MDRRVDWGYGCVLLLSLASCGEPEANTPPGMAGSAGSAAGSLGNQAGQGGSSGQGGSTSPGGSGSSKAGSGPLDCSGTFGTAAPAMPAEPGIRLASPTLSPDQLELIYVREQLEQIEFRRSTRASADAMFPVGSALPALDAACQPVDARSVDLSSDGLRAYVVCYSTMAYPVGSGTLHIADRASLAADFVVRTETQQVGPSAAISADELTLYSSSEIDIGAYPPRRFERATTAEPFGLPEDIPGLEASYLTAPEPAPDGLTLYGGLMGNLMMTVRASRDAAFGEPTVLVPSTDQLLALGAPELSQDCRTLLYIHQLSELPNTTTSTLMAARR